MEKVELTRVAAEKILQFIFCLAEITRLFDKIVCADLAKEFVINMNALSKLELELA